MAHIIIAGGGLDADYYVAKHGSDANDGSFGSPWLTIGKAATSIAAGSVVSVGSGVYDERVTIAAAKSGTAGSETQFVASGSVCVAKGFNVQSDYTTLDGFEVTPGDNTLTDGNYVGQIYVQAGHSTLKNLYIHDLNKACAVVYRGSSASISRDNHLLENSTIYKPSTAAIGTRLDTGDTRWSDDITIRNCTISRWGTGCAIRANGNRWLIEDCEIRGIDAGWNPAVSESQDGDGIWVNDGDGTIIRRCRLYDIWQAVTYTSGGWHADCIQFWQNCTNLLVDSCVLGSWKEGGYDSAPGPLNLVMAGTCNSSCSATFRNNVFMTGISADGLKRNTHTFCAAISSGTLTLNIINNTFFGNAPAFSGSGTMVYTLRNNVFYAHRGDWWKAGSDSDYNAFLWNQWSDAAFAGLQASTMYESEGDGSIGTAYETRLVAADTFTNPDVTATGDYGLNADFSPKAGSALVGAGEYNAAYPQYDITGAARANPPSIGAYE